MTPAEFVEQVYYLQTNTRLSFKPTDDKYKEVLFDANLTLQELEKEQDWSWLKDRLILGPVGHKGNHIPEWELPDFIYKIGTEYGDCIRLHRQFHGQLDERQYMAVPIVRVHTSHMDKKITATEPTRPLTAILLGNTVTFNRPLYGHELHRIAVTDYIKRMKPLHICDDTCEHPCKKIEPHIFDEIPDPLYMSLRVAAYRAEMDPVVNPTKLQSLQDRAQKMLSAMRQNDSGATAPSHIRYQRTGVFRTT